MGRIPVILDVDTGVDDALALLLAVCCPEIDVLAITCVHGNIDVDAVVQNTFKVLDVAGAPSDLPVARGFAEPLIQSVQHCPEIHGQDGLGDLKPPLPLSSRRPWPGHAVQLLNETLRTAAEPVTVVALAPLTNVAIALRTEPELWRSKVARLVWMGGAVSSGGNASAWGEANAAYDPEAAHMVLTSGLPLLIYPWDVFLKLSYSRNELLSFGGGGGADGGAEEEEIDAGEPCSASLLARRLLLRELHYFNVTEAMIGDAGAVAAVVQGSALTIRSLHVAVELHGAHTRGMTVCDLRAFAHPPDKPQEPANADVVVDLDVPTLKEIFSRHVLGGGDVAKTRPHRSEWEVV